MKAIRVHAYGGPEVLSREDIPTPAPGDGEVLVRIEAAGVNFIDVYHRTGLYPLSLPFTPGVEAAGVVETVASGLAQVREGDRVAYVMQPGAYAEHAVVPAWKLVPIPDSLDTRSAAAALLQGLTAHYLTHSTYSLRQGETALVHAAAGGVGLLLVQLAKRLGATVIGTVSTEEKARLAQEAGADHAILYTETDFEGEVKRITGGRGVDVVYDSVGAASFERSLNCLRPRGALVLFGQSSGPVPPLELGRLASKGSLFITRPALAHYVADRAELLQRAEDLFDWIVSGELGLRIHKTYPLEAAAEAHRDLEGRKTAGKLLLVP
ncbi:MAG: quinone oxidoreductase [Gemmatimonadetes bacterium]|nr:quinone oxidoreductase [Gemmatimonadota bacterium]